MDRFSQEMAFVLIHAAVIARGLSEADAELRRAEVKASGLRLDLVEHEKVQTRMVHGRMHILQTLAARPEVMPEQQGIVLLECPECIAHLVFVSGGRIIEESAVSSWTEASTIVDRWKRIYSLGGEAMLMTPAEIDELFHNTLH